MIFLKKLEIFVKGDNVSFSEEARVDGVLYAPYAKQFIIHCSSTALQPIVKGQIVTGSSGITIVSNDVTVQLDRDYVDSFNSASGPEVTVEMKSGSWASFSSTNE